MEYIPVSQLEADIKDDAGPASFIPAFHRLLAIGGGALPSPLANNKFPGWNPKPAIDNLVEPAL